MKRLTGLLVIILTSLASAAEGPAGRWEGAAEIPGRRVPFIIDVAQDKAGQWVGSAIFPGLRIKGEPLVELSVKPPDVSFSLPKLFGGTVIKTKVGGDKMTGEFQQGGQTAPCALSRIGPAQVDEPPRSTALQKELEGEWKGEYELLGQKRQITFKIANEPNGAAKVECVVVGKKTTNVPIELAVQDGDLVTMQAPAFNMVFEGRYQKAGDEFKNTFFYGPFELPLPLRRAAK